MDQAGVDWLIASVRQQDNAIVLRLRGDRRRAYFESRLVRPDPSAFGFISGPVQVSAAYSLLERLEIPAPAGRTLYLDAQDALDTLPLEAIVGEFLRTVPYGLPTIRLSRLAHRPWIRRNSFRLPLRIAGLGRWGDELEGITRQKWWADAARDNGGLFTGLPEKDESALDILVVGSEELDAARDLLRPDAPGAGTRLLVVEDTGEDGLLPHLVRRFPLRSGQSLLVVPKGAPPMDYLLDEVTHDRSFDEIAQSFSVPGRNAVVITDPVATQSLRMSDAASALIDEAGVLARGLVRGDPAGLLEQRPDPALHSVLRTAGEYASLSDTISDAIAGDISFFAESRGFQPLTQARARLNVARDAVAKTQALFANFTSLLDPEVIEPAQSRVVNISMQRTLYQAGVSPMVSPWERLHRGAPYRLLVDIGSVAPESLVIDPPPLDPLLPELEHGGHHVLHVAVYSDDFRIEAPAEAGPVAISTSSPAPTGDPSAPFLRRLILPRVGPSAPVEFVVTPITEGPHAEARIAIYYDTAPGDDADPGPDGYRNHLLQSFLLEASVANADEGYFAETSEGVRIRLDMGQTQRFANLEGLKPRFLSLAVNEGPGEGTHRLMLKRGAQVSAANLTEGLMDEALKAMRALLADLCWNDTKNGPRFSVQPAVSTLSPAFKAALVTLVKAGRQLYEPIRMRFLDKVQGAEMMKAVRDSTDEVIQIMRLDLAFYFPWTVVYDFKQPAADAPVCDGFLRKVGDQPISCDECLKTCLYPDKFKAYCAYGFWGTRHQIEQLVGGNGASETAAHLRPIRSGAVHLSVGLQDGTLGDLEGELRDLLKHRPKDWISVAGPNEDLMSRLREAQSRPAILLVASHCESTKGPLAETPRIQLPGLDHWLEPSALIDEVDDHKAWNDPQPLVVLAACNTAAADLQTMSDFIAAFLHAGASAVVGTEAVIFERLASEFAKTLTPQMLDGRSLGLTILEFRRQLLREGNPLGFLFTAYGPADLAVEAPTAKSLARALF